MLERWAVLFLQNLMRVMSLSFELEGNQVIYLAYNGNN